MIMKIQIRHSRHELRQKLLPAAALLLIMDHHHRIYTKSSNLSGVNKCVVLKENGESKQNSMQKLMTRERQSLNCKLIEFLRDEIILLIESPAETDVSLIRLYNLLRRMQYHFGPDPKNPCFIRFLRISLKNLNYRVSLHLISNGYIRLDSLIVDTSIVPDYLFLLFFYAKNAKTFSAKGHHVRSLDSASLMRVVNQLLPVSNMGAYYEFYGLSLVDLLVECTESEVLIRDCQKSCAHLAICAEITLDTILSQPQFDLKKVVHQCHGKKNPIQRAIDDHKFLLANKLFQKVRNMNSNSIISICNIAIFTDATAALLKSLYSAGFKFEEGFRESFKDQIIHGSDELAQFCEWLKCAQCRVSPLRVQAWNALKNHSDEDLLQEVTDTFLLPEEFTL